MSKVLFRFHRGSLEESMDTVVEVRDKAELLETICEYLSCDGTFPVRPDNSTIEIGPDGSFDQRNGWMTFPVRFQSKVAFQEKHICGWANRMLV